MAIRLNEALRASVGSTDAPNRVLDDSVSSDRSTFGRSWSSQLGRIPSALIRAPGSFDVHSENVAITVNADLEWSA